MDDEIKNNKKILIVEDDESLRKVLAEKFTREGLKVLEAKDGEEGLAVSLRDHPDLILLDIIMPVMDGMTMLNTLRKDDWGRKVPVVILTNVDAVEVSAMNKIAKELGKEPFDYHIKSNTPIAELVTISMEKLR